MSPRRFSAQVPPRRYFSGRAPRDGTDADVDKWRATPCGPWRSISATSSSAPCANWTPPRLRPARPRRRRNRRGPLTRKASSLLSAIDRRDCRPLIGGSRISTTCGTPSICHLIALHSVGSRGQTGTAAGRWSLQPGRERPSDRYLRGRSLPVQTGIHRGLFTGLGAARIRLSSGGSSFPVFGLGGGGRRAGLVAENLQVADGDDALVVLPQKTAAAPAEMV